MVLTVLKTTYPKAAPRVITYRDYSSYHATDFAKDLQRNLDLIQEGDYQPFEDVFVNTLQSRHPLKQKTIRANHKSYVTKEMRKGIMNRSRLQSAYWKCGTETSRLEKKKQENYCNRLYKKERKNENKGFLLSEKMYLHHINYFSTLYSISLSSTNTSLPQFPDQKFIL